MKGHKGSMGGASEADLKQGFTRGDHTHDEWSFYTKPDEYEQQGNARARGGFLTRPQGEER